MISIQAFNLFLLAMAVVAVVVFVCLFFVDAGYGKFYQPKWGPSVDNKLGWTLMEAPVFVAMLALWWFSERKTDIVRIVFLFLFEIHYFHRSFIFPRQIRGKSKMPLSIILMGALFNTLNAFMQGGWIFYFSPADMYGTSWLHGLPFILGTVIFFAGMAVNIQSDSESPAAGGHGALSSQRRYVPLCHERQLFRGVRGMGWLRCPDLVMGGSGVRVVDFRQPCSEGCQDL